MPAQQPDQTAAYQETTGRTRTQLLAYAASLWMAMGSYRDPDIDRFVAAIVPKVLAGQLAIANLTSVHLAAVATRRGNPTRPSPVDSKLVQNGRGVLPEEVYRRPAGELYRALADGVPFDKARERGAMRLESLVATDLQMAKVRQANASLTQPKTLGFDINAKPQPNTPTQGAFRVRVSEPPASGTTSVPNRDTATPSRAEVQSGGATSRRGPVFYRRVLRGEKNCAKCIITSTRRYRVGVLLPIHPGCDCDIEVIDDAHPPPVLDLQLLMDTHEQVGRFTNIANDSGEGYQNLIVTHQHGEIGPVMAWRNQKFKSGAEAKRR